MMSSLRRLGALAGAAALAFGLSACTDLTSSSNTTSSPSSAASASAIDYSACATDDSADQEKFVDRMSVPYLSGATIDFADTIERQGFTIDNPNAQNTCACGESFH